MTQRAWMYKWRFTGTGDTGLDYTRQALTRLEFLELLLKWNRPYFEGTSQYCYWEVP